MKRMIPYLLFYAAVLVITNLACKPKSTVSADVPPPQPDAVQIEVAPAVAAKSEFEDLRDAVKDFVTLLADCDKGWFADVKPERIDKWQLPVDVMAMERQCDRLLSLFGTILEKGAFRSPVMDEFIRASAAVSDRYLVLAFRCKKVGVRDKLPFKQEVAELRDALRADVARLKEGVAKALALSDAQLKTAATVAPEELIPMADAALARLRQDMKTWIEEPLKASKPTWRYCLRTSDAIATAAVGMIRRKAANAAAKLLDPADALARAFAAATTFYTGAYFDNEEKEGPKVRGAVARADVAYRNAARRVVKK